MTMRTSLRILALGTALVGTGLNAQDANKSWSVGLNLTSALDGLKEVTHKSAGVAVDFGYTGHVGNSTVPFRASLGIQMFPGSDYAGVKQSLSSFQLAGDIFVPTPWKDLQFITGLSVNKYKVKAEAAGISESETVKGVKLGARLGMEYRFNAAWSGQLMVQMTELGTDALATRGVNPSWLQAGVKFHF